MTPYLILPDALTPAECDAVIALAAASQMSDAGLVRAKSHDIRRADLAWLDDLPEAAWVMDRMVRLVAEANREGFRFDLDDFAESAQVARYGAERQGHFDWHSDIGAGPLAARRKLTVVVQLSEPADYQGGVLELRPDSNVAQVVRGRGTAVVFPSFVLHRVTPVTIGVRWSLTLWAHGPAFR
ncbi:MAG: 2OG-Fe(II) oxygenase [Paracoccaceae bacterium]